MVDSDRRRRQSWREAQHLILDPSQTFGLFRKTGFHQKYKYKNGVCTAVRFILPLIIWCCTVCVVWTLDTLPAKRSYWDWQLFEVELATSAFICPICDLEYLQLRRGVESDPFSCKTIQLSFKSWNVHLIDLLLRSELVELTFLNWEKVSSWKKRRRSSLSAMIFWPPGRCLRPGLQVSAALSSSSTSSFLSPSPSSSSLSTLSSPSPSSSSLSSLPSPSPSLSETSLL